MPDEVVDEQANRGGDGSTPPGASGFEPVSIEDEVRNSFLVYSMSVIINRALPDVRDGLKPVHRRILFAMHDEGLLSNRPFSKSAGVVGEVLKHYHPHGDSAVYDSMVRMAQDFSLRYPLIDGQGNFGSIDGDPPAAYRYTEARLDPLAEEMLRDIDRQTVDFQPNFDDQMEEPTVLPARFPNLLANGSSGIAVGMATNIPPHNLNELSEALIHEARNPDCSFRDLMEKMPGPDFPTGGQICGSSGIRSYYATGRGHLTLRAKAEFEETKRGATRIVISEIPYQVNKSMLIERIADMVREGRVVGITDLRDESSREGMRIVIELRRGAAEEVILNQLYKMTPLQTTFGVNLLALVNGRPQTLSVKQCLRSFLDFRKQVVTRRAIYELAQAEARAHILEGFAVALDHLDEIIALIRASESTAEARDALMQRFDFSERQAQAILDMRLRALTALERRKVQQELDELRAKIADLKDLVASDQRILDVVIEEAEEVAQRFGDDRRSQITEAVEGISSEDLIIEEEMVVTLSRLGYIKRNRVTLYRAQQRGGKGARGMETRQEDFVRQLCVASTHAYLLFFTNLGRVYWLKVHELPQLSRAARGKAVVNVLDLSPGERIRTMLPVRSFEHMENQSLLLVTRQGLAKKTLLSAYANPRRAGIIAIKLNQGDELIGVERCSGDDEVIIATQGGKSIRFAEGQVRPMGRSAAGVHGIRLAQGDGVVGMTIVHPGSTIFTITANGYGKRTPLEAYRRQQRGGRGIITIRTTARNGPVVGMEQVIDSDELMLITNGGKVLRCAASGISVMGRATQGVRVMDLAEDEKIVAAERMAEADTERRAGPTARPAPGSDGSQTEASEDEAGTASEEEELDPGGEPPEEDEEI